VINFDFPLKTSDYLHRAGRTGRNGKSGTVINFYSEKDESLIKKIQESI